jgi:hypothetical protein
LFGIEREVVALNGFAVFKNFKNFNRERNGLAVFNRNKVSEWLGEFDVRVNEVARLNAVAPSFFDAYGESEACPTCPKSTALQSVSARSAKQNFRFIVHLSLSVQFFVGNMVSDFLGLILFSSRVAVSRHRRNALIRLHLGTRALLPTWHCAT